MTLPNFILIGAPKSGTTSLYHYLKAHPEVFMSSLKESYFFSEDKYKDPELLAEFEDLFKDVKDEKAIGEACATYIFHGHAHESIKSVIPDAKLIVILRDPAERAYSDYIMSYRTGHRKLNVQEDDIETSFLNFLGEDNSSYFYFECLSRYLKNFDRNQLKVMLFDDLKNKPQQVARECFEFLDVDPNFELEIADKVFNKGGMPKNEKLFLAMESLRQAYRPALARMLPDNLYSQLRSGYSGVRSMNMKSKSVKLSTDGRKKVIDIHRDDTLRLQDFLARDLSHWLEC